MYLTLIVSILKVLPLEEDLGGAAYLKFYHTWIVRILKALPFGENLGEAA